MAKLCAVTRRFRRIFKGKFPQLSVDMHSIVQARKADFFSKIITLEKYATLEEQVTTRLRSQSQLFEVKISSEFILG